MRPKRTIPEDFPARFPATTDKDLTQHYHASLAMIRRWAAELGLRKTSAHISQTIQAALLGHVHSVETRAKIAAKHRGKKMAPETIARIVATKRATGGFRSGPRHYKWRGGGGTWKRMLDPRYGPWRNAVLQRDDYTCQFCAAETVRPGIGLHAHHIKPYLTFSELRYEVSNGLTLCQLCHSELHGRQLPIPRLVFCACGCGRTVWTPDRQGISRRYVVGHTARSGKGRKHSDEMIECACGCGKFRRRYDATGRERTYIHGHQARGKQLTAEHRTKLKGRTLSQETREKLRQAKLGKPSGTKGRPSPLKGRTRPPEIVDKTRRALTGRPKSPEHRAALVKAWEIRRERSKQH